MTHQKKILCILSSIIFSLIPLGGYAEIKCTGQDGNTIIAYKDNQRVTVTKPDKGCKDYLKWLKNLCSKGWKQSDAYKSYGCLRAKITKFDEGKNQHLLCTIKADCKYGSGTHINTKSASNTCFWASNWHGTSSGGLNCKP